MSGAVVDPDQFGEFVQSAAGGNPVGAPDDKKLRGPGAQPVGGLGPTVVGGEHHVEVRPAEPERGHTGVPARRGCRPRTSPGVEEERAGCGVPVGIGLGEVQRRRAHPGFQRLHRLDQTGQAGRTLGVPDLGLHRTDRAARRRRPVGGEDLGQAGELRPVTDDRAGCMRLDQADVGRGDAGSGVCPLHRQHLACLARSGQAQRPAVARSGHRLDHSMDAVTVAFGVGKPFEHDDGHTLAQADAVGGRVETAGPAGR